MDQTNLLERLTALLAEHQIRYCVIDGQAVNAYVEPLVSHILGVSELKPAPNHQIPCNPWEIRVQNDCRNPLLV